MRDYIIIHDKLLEYGGAEAVLSCLVRYRRPKMIICSCISNKIFWEEKFQTKIVSPYFTRFIRTQRLYKLMYPFVIMVCFFSFIARPYKDAFFLVYSSSAGKYFPLTKYGNSILYVNFHAKGVNNGCNYFKFLKTFLFLGNVFEIFQRFVLYFENRVAERFRHIYAISKDALNSLSNVSTIGKGSSVGVLHCPAVISSCLASSSQSKLIPDEAYFVVISRLYPEKMLEEFLAYLYSHTKIKIIVVGDGVLRNNLIKKFPNRFSFPGFLDSGLKNDILRSCIALLQPTSQEWSLVAVEANMMGIPVIASTSVGMREINETISGFHDFPNLLYNSFSELRMTLENIEPSRLFLNSNSDHVNWIFSERLFHKRLAEIELSIF